MLIAITGGIGSGKSVIARALLAMGYSVYDCDNNARNLINNSAEIKSAISRLIGQDCTTPEGLLNRKIVGDVVFNNPEKLDGLNKITHAAVREDIAKWEEGKNDDLLFVETAILYQSKIDKMVNAVIDVVAPTSVRVERIRKRNGLSDEEILSRIKSQQFNIEEPHDRVYAIVNDGNSAIIPQLQKILEDLKELIVK